MVNTQMGLAISLPLFGDRNERPHGQPAPTRPQRNWKSTRVVNLLDIVGRTPCKKQLHILIKRRPIAVRILNEINGEFEYQEIKDPKIVDMNCLAYISYRTKEGKHVRESLHSVATNMGYRHNCSNSILKGGDGSLYLLETVVVFL